MENGDGTVTSRKLFIPIGIKENQITFETMENIVLANMARIINITNNGMTILVYPNTTNH